MVRTEVRARAGHRARVRPGVRCLAGALPPAPGLPPGSALPTPPGRRIPDRIPGSWGPGGGPVHLYRLNPAARVVGQPCLVRGQLAHAPSAGVSAPGCGCHDGQVSGRFMRCLLAVSLRCAGSGSRGLAAAFLVVCCGPAGAAAGEFGDDRVRAVDGVPVAGERPGVPGRGGPRCAARTAGT